MDPAARRRIVTWNLHMMQKIREHPWSRVGSENMKHLRNAIASVCMDAINGYDFDECRKRATRWLKSHTTLRHSDLISLFNSVPSHQTNFSMHIDEEADHTCISVISGGSTMVSMRIPSERAERIQKKASGVEDIVGLVHRYSFACTAYQFFWSIPPSVYEAVNDDRLEVIEAFASPFNNNLDKYCSLYDEDRMFGSLGNFFDVICSPRGEKRRRWIINPPFTNSVMNKVRDVLIENTEDEYMFLLPNWPSHPLYQFVQQIGVVHVLPKGTYHLYDHFTCSLLSPPVDMMVGMVNVEDRETNLLQGMHVK